MIIKTSEPYRLRLGIDVGGTFTDFAVQGAGSELLTFKALSTPKDPSLAVIQGLMELAKHFDQSLESFLGRVEVIVHGTTVTTNAVLTGQVARTALLTTRGFRDALQMRRGVREVMYDNRYQPPAPIVPREHRLPISERIDATGAILTPIALTDVEDAAAILSRDGIEAVAISFMHAHRDAQHELAAATVIASRMPGVYLSVSSQVLPQIRFYERTSTTVLNAAVGPIFARYASRLTDRLVEAGFEGLLLIMQSNGGVAHPRALIPLAASTLLSGPAAAPAAGLASSRRDRFISVDMGGTSFDATLVIDGSPAVTTASAVNRYAMALSAMDINTIGAGGGSIAWIDEGGLLHMGPQSAGADPGPACYGRGGTAPTCTDANLVLGYLAGESIAGGRVRLDPVAAQQAIARHIAAPLGLSVLEAAQGMFDVINVNMAAAIREISVERGHDPRDFPLIVAGGAGPIHAAAIAAELGIPEIVIPRDAGTYCATGMLFSDFKHDYVRSCPQRIDEGARGDRVAAAIRDMEDKAHATLAAEGISKRSRTFRFDADLRYLGQYHEVTVTLSREALMRGKWRLVREAFHQRHDALYGYALRDQQAPIELLNVRLTAIGRIARPAPPDEVSRRKRARTPHPTLERPVYVPSLRRHRPAPVFDLHRLAAGAQIDGPAVIEGATTTILVPSGHRARIDELGNTLLAKTRQR